MRESFERQRDHFLGADEIALRFGRAEALLCGDATERAAGIELARATLAYDPYNVTIHRALAIAHAGGGAQEAIYEHLAICFDLGEMDIAAMRADPSLRGALTKEAFESIFERIEAEARHRTRFRDVSFAEIGPRTRAYETTLVWKPEHHAAVVEAHERLIEAASRQYEAAGLVSVLGPASEQFSLQRERLASPFTLDDRLIGLQCHFGSVHRFLREVAPYVEDVRFLMYDQVSPIDEVWIVGGAFHVCRHPLYDSDMRQRAELFEKLYERELARDEHLRGYVAMLWSSVAHVELEASENQRSHSDPTGGSAAHAIERLLALGRRPNFFQARLAFVRKQVAGAARHLEDTLLAQPDHREAVIMLARCRLDERRFEEAVAHAERAAALNPRYCDDAHLVRAIALESLGRVDEARKAYVRYTEIRRDSPGIVVRDADALLARGWLASARLVYEQLLGASSTFGIAAELGLARCTERLGERDASRRHYERVLERGAEMRAEHARTRPPPALEALEAAARAALGR